MNAQQVFVTVAYSLSLWLTLCQCGSLSLSVARCSSLWVALFHCSSRCVIVSVLGGRVQIVGGTVDGNPVSDLQVTHQICLIVVTTDKKLYSRGNSGTI